MADVNTARLTPPDPYFPASPSRLAHIQTGPHHILLDKSGLLAGQEFPLSSPNMPEQTEKLRRLVYWFWHDLSHFMTAMGRGQLWWARGQLDALRSTCVNLTRLGRNFSDDGVGEEPYFKLDEALPPDDLTALEATFGTMERDSMLRSARRLLRAYKDLALPLAQARDSVPI